MHSALSAALNVPEMHLRQDTRIARRTQPLGHGSHAVEAGAALRNPSGHATHSALSAALNVPECTSNTSSSQVQS